MAEPSPSQAALEARIDALEIRIAYQDETIETLNVAITEQWQTIEALRREIARLGEQINDAGMKDGPDPASEPPPPHY